MSVYKRRGSVTCKLPQQTCPYCGVYGHHNPSEYPRSRSIYVVFQCNACRKTWNHTFSKDYEDKY